MNDSDSVGPQGPARRALPSDHTGGAASAPRRDASTPEHDIFDAPHPWFRGAGGWVVLVASVIVVLALWSMLRPPTDPPPVIVATNSPSATTTSPTAPPTSTSQAVSPTPDPSVPTPADTNPSTPDPAETAPPLPATALPGPPISVPPEPSPDSSTTAGLVELNDASFMGAAGWSLYGDELIEEDRRVVRLRDAATDTRLQAVTLLPGKAELSESCGSLVELQQTQFTEVTRQLVAPIGVEPRLGTGVRCGFSGVRSSDGVPNTVSFTLVSRATDSHVLMLRSTVPDALPSDSPAIAQLLSMSCQASARFGVPLPLC